MKKIKWIEVEEYVNETASRNYHIEKDELSIKRKFNIAVLNSTELSHEEKENEVMSCGGDFECIIKRFTFKRNVKLYIILKIIL